MPIPTNDPLKPNIVHAADPHNRGKFLRLLASPKTITIWAAAFGSEAKLGEFVGLVHGNFDGPPAGTTGLLYPTAIFKGLKRPLHHVSMTADTDVYVYVTNPPYNYTYPLRNKFGDKHVEIVDKPRLSVFTTFVSLKREHIDVALAGVQNPGSLDGVVLFWEWTEASSKDALLPYDWNTRFDQRVP